MTSYQKLAQRVIGGFVGGARKDKEAAGKAADKILVDALAKLLEKSLDGNWLAISAEGGKKVMLGVDGLAAIETFLDSNPNIDVVKLQVKFTAEQVKLGLDEAQIASVQKEDKVDDVTTAQDTTAIEPVAKAATEAKGEKSSEDPIVTALKARELVCQCPACKANPESALKGKGESFKVPARWILAKDAKPEDLVSFAMHRSHAWRIGAAENTAWFAYAYVGLQKIGQRQERYEADKATATSQLTGKALVYEGDIGWWGYTGRGDFRQVRRLKDCVVPPMDYVRANTRGPVDPPTLMAFAIPKGLAGKMKPHQNAGLVEGDFTRLDIAMASLWSNFAHVTEKSRDEMEPQGGTSDDLVEDFVRD